MPSHFVLINDRVRSNAIEAIRKAPDGHRVQISEPKRSGDQNAFLHSLLNDIAKSGMKWAGKERSSEEWKMLVVSAHAVATGHQGEVIPGLEGEFVAIRESTASMTVARASSLLEYVLAFCHSNGVELTETRERGFMDGR